MRCPYCGHGQSQVIDTRDTDDSAMIRRRRTCVGCDKRFTTYERVEGLELKVVKKDGTKEDYDREKLRRGVVKATWKRPVSMADIEELLDDVERKVRLKDSIEVKSWEVGNLVLNRLRKLDALAYLLFASVYRDFDSLADFKTEIEKLDGENDLVTTSAE